MQRDKEVVLAAVTQHGSVLYLASEEIKRDKEVVLAAVSNNSTALSVVRDVGLLGNKEIILAAISAASSKTDISLTAYYNFTRNNVDFVLIAFKKHVSHHQSRMRNWTLNIEMNAKRLKGEEFKLEHSANSLLHMCVFKMGQSEETEDQAGKRI